MTKRKAKSKQRANSPKRSARVISRAKNLLDEGLLYEATMLLQQHVDRFPADAEALELWMSIIYDEATPLEIWDVARRLYKIDPSNMEYVVDLVEACMHIPMPFTALQLIETHDQQLRDHGDFGFDLENYSHLLKEVRDTVTEQLRVTDGMTTTHIANIEELRCLYHNRAFDEAQTLADQLWDDFPDPVMLCTTMSDGYGIQGDYAEATRLAQEAHTHNPSDFEAFTNLIIYTFKDGKLDNNSPLIDTLRAKTEFETAFELTSAIEIWAWLGDDAMVTQLFEQHQDLSDIDHSSMAHHLAATSYAFLGDEKKAKKLWRKALKLNRNLAISQENLDDLKLAVGQRHGPWHFQEAEWIPTGWMEQVFKATSAPTEKQAERHLQKFYDNMPALQFILPHIFKRGSNMVVEFAIQIAGVLKLPILTDFALGQRGSDDLRIEAANWAARNGLLPRGKPNQLYIKGQLDEVILMAYQIHSETDRKPPPRAIRNVIKDAYNLIQRERYDSALTLVQDGLEKAPDDPTLLNYLATLHRAQGQHDEEAAVIRHTYEVHPDYFFGRCGMMEVYAREGNFEAADALLEPMLTMESFHYSEFGMFCKAHVALLTAKRDFTSAYSWLDMWERIHPELVEIKKIRREVKRAERDADKAN